MLSEKQLKGAWMIANGRTDKEAHQAAGVAENTLYRWKRRPEFMAVVGILSEQKDSNIAAKAKELVSLASARDDEVQALSYQRQMVSELGQLSVDLIKHIRDNGVEELGPRYLSPIVKSFADAVGVLQATNDRLIGLEALIEDVKVIEQKISLQDEPISEGGGDGRSR